MLLKDKIALVTGAGRGIGLGIAERFAKEGARIIIADRDGASLDKSAGNLVASGIDVLAVAADLAVEAEVERLFQRIQERYGALDILVNNARQHVEGDHTSFLKLSSDVFNRIQAANLGMLFYCTQRAARMMARQRHGSIINISTIGAVRAHRRRVATDTMKGAMDTFTRAVAVDLAPWGIRVNSLQPGTIATDAFARLAPEEQKRRTAAIPLGRIAWPADVAWACVFLASDEAGFVTGQAIQLDGGLLAAARSPQAELEPVIGPDDIAL